MNALIMALEYAPILQLLLFYVFFYFKDLGRIAHPKVRRQRQKNGLLDWYDALKDIEPSLSLSESEKKRLSSSEGRKFLYFFIPPLLLSYITDLLLYEGIPAWYMSMIFQTVSALLLLIALSYTYFGPMASYGAMHSTKLSDTSSRIFSRGEEEK